MGISMLDYENNQIEDMGGDDLQVKVFLIYHSPEEFFRLLMTSYFYQKDVLDQLYILTLSLQY